MIKLFLTSITDIGPIQTVSLYVSDQDDALTYTETLGFELRRDNPTGGDHRWIEVAPKDAETALVLYPRTEESNLRKHKPSLVFHADDVVALCQKLADAGVQIEMEPQSYPWGVFAAIADPGGNKLSIRTPSEGYE
jgi:predicted enzyme related to lactoylglutathione lyase